MENQKNSKGIITILIISIIILLALIILIGTGMISFKPNVCINNQKTNDIQNNDTNNSTSSNSNIIKQKSSVNKSQILSYYKDIISDISDSNHLYSVVDINNDDIPELFIYITGTIGNQIIANTSVYTYDENKGDKSNNYVVYIGSINGRIDNNTILYKMNDGKLLSVFGQMGYETTTYFKLENDWLIRTDFSSKETNEYISGDNEIEFKPCTDTSLIENYN